MSNYKVNFYQIVKSGKGGTIVAGISGSKLSPSTILKSLKATNSPSGRYYINFYEDKSEVGLNYEPVNIFKFSYNGETIY